MLVLTRRSAQEIRFPDQHIRVEVLAVKAGVVRLGVEAPPEVRVLRGELPDRVAEWGPEPEAAPEPGQLEQLTRNGLTLASGSGDPSDPASSARCGCGTRIRAGAGPPSSTQAWSGPWRR